MKNSLIKGISVVCAVILSVFVFTCKPSDVFATGYSMTDYASDVSWSVQISDNTINITTSDTYKAIPVDSPVIACSVYKGVFSFLSHTNHNDNLVAMWYTYDTNSGSFTSTITPLPILINENRFAADNQGKFYLVDYYDNHLINCFYNGSVINTIRVKSTVKQLLCTNGTDVTVITEDGIFVISDSDANLVSDASPVVPCTYIGNGIIRDATGIDFNYENGCIYQIVPETTVKETLPQSGVVLNGSYIIPDYGTTVAALRKNLNASKDDFVVYKNDGSIYKQGKLGSGMSVRFSGNTYVVIIYGELTGEGNINSRDLKLMMKFLTGEVTPNETQQLSADINRDGILCTKDLLALSKLY